MAKCLLVLLLPLVMVFDLLLLLGTFFLIAFERFDDDVDDWPLSVLIIKKVLDA